MPQSPTTSLFSEDSFTKPSPPRLARSFSSPAATDTAPTKKDPSWRDRLRARYAPEQPGKEKWRDASLSEKERWKQWHKAKDQEQKAGLTATYFGDFYRAKGGWAWWLADFT